MATTLAERARNAAKARAWRAKNPERLRQINAANYIRHREDRLEARRLYRARYPERVCQTNANCYMLHREARAAIERARYHTKRAAAAAALIQPN